MRAPSRWNTLLVYNTNASKKEWNPPPHLRYFAVGPSRVSNSLFPIRPLVMGTNPKQQTLCLRTTITPITCLWSHSLPKGVLGIWPRIPGSIPSSGKNFVIRNTFLGFRSQCSVKGASHTFSMGYAGASKKSPNNTPWKMLSVSRFLHHSEQRFCHGDYRKADYLRSWPLPFDHRCLILMTVLGDDGRFISVRDGQ